MLKTGGTATLTGNIKGSALILNGPGGTLNLGTNLTDSITGNWTRANGALVLGSSKLYIGGTTTNTAGTFTAGTGLVNYYGANTQVIAPLSYYNLTLSGAGAKTLSTTSTVADTRYFANFHTVI